ncbi:MAG: response regulator transcription factor [Alphaproteobacteria bacterium]|nr:response regulator transcription factor [Alphaproteobacteria bacterium]
MTALSAAAEPHLLVVDDDRRLRALLGRYLGGAGYRVTGAADTDEARRQLAALAFDLVVLDVMLPGEDGFQFARWLRGRQDVPILLLTARGQAEDRIEGLKTGADDYLAKPFEPEELNLRIAAILRRRRQAGDPATPLSVAGWRFDAARGELARGQEVLRLTQAEAAIMRTLAAQPGRAVAREALLSGSGEGSLRAVDVQVVRLRRKLEADPKQPRHLVTVWGEGYALWPD